MIPAITRPLVRGESRRFSRRIYDAWLDSGERVGEMLGRPFGIILLAAVLLAAGLAGIAAFWAAWPRTSNTSPLVALFALAWSCAYMLAGVLTWRRSRFAATAFIAAIGLLMFPLSFLFPGSGQLFLLPSFVVIVLFTFLGYRYLRRGCEPAA
jgi:hypothetical protein